MTFHRKVFQIEVLSDSPLNDMSLEQINYAMSMGDCIGREVEVSDEEITSKQCAKLCYELGSEPEFFQLSDEGSPIDYETPTKKIE